MHTGSTVVVGNTTFSFTDYYAGTLKASYSFDEDGFLDGVGEPGGTGDGTNSTGYNGIHWVNPSGGATGHGQWVRNT